MNMGVEAKEVNAVYEEQGTVGVLGQRMDSESRT